MEEIIKNIIQIDKEAIEKQERTKQVIEEKESQKKALLKKIKDEINLSMKQEIEDAKKSTQNEVDAETEKIKSESAKKLEQLEITYKEISDSLVDEAFEIVLRSLEG